MTKCTNCQEEIELFDPSVHCLTVFAWVPEGNNGNGESVPWAHFCGSNCLMKYGYNYYNEANNVQLSKWRRFVNWFTGKTDSGQREMERGIGDIATLQAAFRESD